MTHSCSLRSLHFFTRGMTHKLTSNADNLLLASKDSSFEHGNLYRSSHLGSTITFFYEKSYWNFKKIIFFYEKSYWNFKKIILCYRSLPLDTVPNSYRSASLNWDTPQLRRELLSSHMLFENCSFPSTHSDRYHSGGYFRVGGRVECTTTDSIKFTWILRKLYCILHFTPKSPSNIAKLKSTHPLVKTMAHQNGYQVLVWWSRR